MTSQLTDEKWYEIGYESYFKAPVEQCKLRHRSMAGELLRDPETLDTFEETQGSQYHRFHGEYMACLDVLIAAGDIPKFLTFPDYIAAVHRYHFRRYGSN